MAEAAVTEGAAAAAGVAAAGSGTGGSPAPAAASTAGGDFKAADAVSFLTEHGVDAKSLEGVPEADLKARYEGAKTVAEKAIEKVKASAQKAPEKYELKPAQGQTVNAELNKEFEGLARGANLSQEQAQKVYDLGGKIAAQIANKNKADVEAIQKGWSDAAKADKELGGEKFDENLAISKKGLDAVATPEFVKWLNESRLGNHPEMLRAFYRVGKMMGEDKTTQGRESRSDKDIADRLYGGSKK